MFSGISVDNLIGRIITGKGVDGCSCMINESILLRTLLLSCTEVNGSPGECIVTGHGFERKSWGGGGGEGGRKKTEVIEASNQCCLLALPPSGSRVYIHICMYVCISFSLHVNAKPLTGINSYCEMRQRGRRE